MNDDDEIAYLKDKLERANSALLAIAILAPIAAICAIFAFPFK